MPSGSIPRATMADLIGRLRDLIGDPAGASQMFTDGTLQDWLDETRRDVRYEPLKPKPTYVPGGVQWNDYYSQDGHWEQGVVLIWTNFSTLTPLTPLISDLIVGHWGFANQLPSVFAAGQNYDVWNTAANLLEMKATQLTTTTFSFSAAGTNFQAGQIITNLHEMASRYRMRKRLGTVSYERADLARLPMASNPTRPEIGAVSSGVPFLTGP